MSNKENQNQQQEEGVLELKEAQNMTVEEAKRKGSELQVGISEEDSVLDKYIKRHREEIADRKFTTESGEDISFKDLDTSALDKFIKKQKEELATAGLINEAVLSETEDDEQETKIIPSPVLEASKKDEILSQEQRNILPEDEVQVGTEEDLFALEEEEQDPVYKNKKLIFALLGALVVGIFGIAYGLNYFSNQATTTSSSSTSKSSTAKSKTSSSSTEKTASQEDVTNFENLYKNFFVDEEQTKLKNSEFANLSSLEEALKKLEGTTAYDDAKSKYDKLSKAIATTQAVNAQFESAAIVDGEAVADVAVKSDANFDSITTDMKNTGNAILDSLLQQVITSGRTQQSGGVAAVTNTSEVSVPATGSDVVAVTEEAATTPSSETSSQTSEVTQTVPAASATTIASTSYGIQNYDPAILQRQMSRVPYNETAVADKTNAAWIFTPGVMEKIIATSQARGYITGNEFILEPVNIINGVGYYNMYKPDGTYLFSINCKTGYFVGNASGNSDALDF
ncbi:cell division site-positioning protein MapZ family protein [Streptococcus sp. SGI.013]|uniref:cell division site-positioning protein MapZ family protein n=1 Tax=unclassified Streptococcus TaxID=2608887 RepID=UPI003D06134F